MKILITGAAGFLGSYLVEHFLKEGHEVIGIDNFSGGNVQNLYSVTKDSPLPLLSFMFTWGYKNFKFVRRDCKDLKAMQNWMEGVDVVYHCACNPHEGLSVFSPSHITDSVFGASVSVISAAIANGVKRFIYMSSMARYGEPIYTHDIYGVKSKVGCKFDERQFARPVDPYGIAKKAAEDVLIALGEEHGMEYIIAVPHNIIGVRQNCTDPFRNVASIMMNRVKQGLPINIYGDGLQTRCFSPIEDCLDCLVKLATIDYAKFGQGTLKNTVINIGPDKNPITIKDLAHRVSSLQYPQGITINYLPPRPLEVKHASCNSGKARRLLDYKEIKSLDDCLEEMWNAIPEGGMPFKHNLPLEIINEKTPRPWIKNFEQHTTEDITEETKE